MDELVVGYRNGELRKKLRVKHAMLGALCLLPGLLFVVAYFVLFLNSIFPPAVLLAIGIVVGLLAVLGVLMMAGLFIPGTARAEAPNGVAWVLRRDGVMVNTPRGPVHTPWSQVRISAATVAGQPAVSVGGPQATTTYAAEYLTHNQQQLDAAARQLSQPIWS
ncbi:hypothetical protein [Granulicoccus phenolivorans]|uniref:hypothetical protein n=1 Tax=Granulicoccus phenolivorans TaxID=266854 RepID=UPI0003F53555|nr:hypothetical protein [Granulicoccus phenolivorans]